MSQIPTVRGPVDSADLGPAYMHEHIFVLTADVQQNYPGEWGSEDDRVADAVARLRALAAQGIRTIVDPGRTGRSPLPGGVPRRVVSARGFHPERPVARDAGAPGGVHGGVRLPGRGGLRP